MSLEIWPPPSSPSELKRNLAQAKERELSWAVEEVLSACVDLKHGLQDCYALLAPIDPGSTLVMSTPRNEKVKGTITRVGTRIVKASLNLQLRLLPTQSLALLPSCPVHIDALDALHVHLTQAIDLLALSLSPESPRRSDPVYLSSTLSLLADSLSASAALLKGPPPALSDPSWQTCSCAPDRFEPPLPTNVSFHLGLQESCIVLWLRILEPVDAPLHFGMKLGLAIGTVRRLEHDEMDVVYRFKKNQDKGAPSSDEGQRQPSLPPRQSDGSSPRGEDVYVREKVRVESADPSLISLYSKLRYLSHMLGQARRNLAAVMGEEI